MRATMAQRRFVFFFWAGSISAELVIVTYLMQGRVHVEDVVR